VAERLLGLEVRIPSRAWMFVLCVISKDRDKMQGNEDKETSTDEEKVEY
jgi:hypothetical protein